uniref:Uncharacterized protein n=1 Tax=Glossina pallidipes TaxID=7398 RepID=A0A1B0A7E6_GLOPL
MRFAKPDKNLTDIVEIGLVITQRLLGLSLKSFIIKKHYKKTKKTTLDKRIFSLNQISHTAKDLLDKILGWPLSQKSLKSNFKFYTKSADLLSKKCDLRLRKARGFACFRRDMVSRNPRRSSGFTVIRVRMRACTPTGPHSGRAYGLTPSIVGD